MAKVFKHVGLWLAVLFAALCTAGLFAVHAEGESSALYQKVLGEAVNFGVVAESFSPANDLQSNFATNKFTPSEHGIHSDLTGDGKYAGNYWITSVVENGNQPFKNYIEQNKKSQFYVGESTKNSPVFLNVDSSNIHSISDETLRDDVNGLINTALKNGEDLAKKPATASVEPSKQSDGKVLDTSATLDTTKIDADVIYVDGDQAANYPFDNGNGTRYYVNFLEEGRLTVTKKANQTIVFNFTGNTQNNTNKLTLGRLLAVKDQNNSDVNKLDQTEHIIYNVQTTKYSDIDQGELNAVLLVNNSNVKIVGKATSQGWIVTNGFFSNVKGEWHNIYPGTKNIRPDTPTPTEEKGSLTFTKTFGGGVTEEDLSNISFTVTGPDNYSKTFTLGDIKQNDGTYSKTLTDLTLGKYTVTENKADNVEGYSLVKEGTITSGETTLTTSSKTATIALNDNYQPTKPEQPTEEKGSLTFTKTFDGDNVTAEDLKNISFEVKGPNNYDQVFFLKDIKKDDGTYSKTLTDLEWGKYTVTENYADDVNGYKLEETSIVKGSTEISGTQLKGTVNLNDTYTQKKGSLTFTKTFGGGVTEEDLSNISFNVTGPHGYNQTYSLADIKNTDGTYSKTLNNLEWGTYTVKEINADKVNGYTLDKTSHIEGHVTVDATHLEGDANTINLTDNYSPVHPRVQLFKNEFYNGDLTGNPVGGASYALYRWKGSKASLQLFTMLTRASVDPATETDWSKVTRSDIMNSDNWEYLGEDNTDGTGFVCSKDELNEGDIVAALEVTAPAGYQRTANPAILQVHVNKAATLISDSDGAVSLDKDGNLQWKETVVRIGIKKVDANGNAVVGAKMAVLDKDGKVIDTWTTTKDNLVHETDKLTAGETYTLRELQAPEGYEKAADVTFTAEAKDIKGTDEYVQSVTMIDQKSQPAKPGTPSKGTTVKPAQTVAQGVKTGDPTTIGGLVLMFAAAGAVLVLSAKHLKAMR